MFGSGEALRLGGLSGARLLLFSLFLYIIAVATIHHSLTAALLSPISSSMQFDPVYVCRQDKMCGCQLSM